MSSNDSNILKYEEMQILCAAAGITQYYGMNIPDQEITQKDVFNELLFRMVKRKQLKIDDKIYLEEPLLSIFRIIEKADDIFLVYPRDERYPTTCYYYGDEIAKVQNGSRRSREMRVSLISKMKMQEELMLMQEEIYQDEEEEKEIFFSDFDGCREDGAAVIAREDCLFLMDHIKCASNSICSRLSVERRGLFEWINYQEDKNETILYERQRFMTYIHRMMGGCV